MKFRIIAIAAALFMAGCASKQPPLSFTQNAPLGVWTLVYGAITRPKVDPSNNSFTFGTVTDGGSANYLIEGVNKPIPMGSTITATFKLEGSGTLVQTDPRDNSQPRVRLFIERKGDDLSGAGDMQSYRWWSKNYVDIASPGTYTLTEKVTPDRWTDVYAREGSAVPALFGAAIANPSNIGETFGGQFAGHGLYVKSGGPIKFTLISFTVN